ncbi:MAG: MFS transporter [Immundisolibacter sp.]|uniref:MFS transporter n=1 Tax=Immundisolibacter sp. TaxID=1934948 RepID=UPI003EE34821
MNSSERRVTGTLSVIYILRMLGLFLLLPVLALYVEGLPGSTPLKVGLAVGMYGFTQALFGLPFGTLSDHFGRKQIITLGLGLFAAGSLLAAVAQSANGIIAGRALQGAGAVAAPIMALLADLLRPEQRTKGMAVIGISIGGSYLIALPLGPVLAAWLQVPGLFVLIAVLAAMMIAVLWLAVPTPVTTRPVGQSGQQFRAALTDPHLLRLDFSIMALHILMTATFVALPPLLRDGLNLAPSQHPWLYLPTVLLSIVAMVPLIVYAEKRHQLKSVFIAMIGLLAGGLLLLVEASHTLWAVAAGLVAFLTAFNVLEATLPSIMSRLAPIAGRGTAMGLYSTSQFLGAFIGGVGAGWLRGHYGAQGVFLGGLGVCVVWLAVAIGLRPPTPLQTRLIEVGNVTAARARSLTDELAALTGVAEAVVIPEEGVAYLRVDGTRFEPASLERFKIA